MKRWMLISALASALALGLAACGEEETKPEGEPNDNPSTTCTVDQTAACEGKCGTITVKDSCDADVSVDCGDTCGDGTSCSAETNTCEADAPTEPTPCATNSDCADNEYCDQDSCDPDSLVCECKVGARGTKACGEAIELSANECASAIAMDAADGSYCSCFCEDNNGCPTTLPDCNPYAGLCTD